MDNWGPKSFLFGAFMYTIEDTAHLVIITENAKTLLQTSDIPVKSKTITEEISKFFGHKTLNETYGKLPLGTDPEKFEQLLSINLNKRVRQDIPPYLFVGKLLTQGKPIIKLSLKKGAIAPLLQVADDDTTIQPAYLYMDLTTGVVTAGALTREQKNNTHHIKHPIPHNISADALDIIFRDELMITLLAKILAGTEGQALTSSALADNNILGLWLQKTLSRKYIDDDRFLLDDPDGDGRVEVLDDIEHADLYLSRIEPDGYASTVEFLLADARSLDEGIEEILDFARQDYILPYGDMKKALYKLAGAEGFDIDKHF
jgi:hypothetical protein